MEETPVIDLYQIPRYQDRQYILEEIDFLNTQSVKNLFEGLLNTSINSPEELLSWLTHRSELEAAITHEGNIRYIQMTCQTDDPHKAGGYQFFVKEIIPAIKPLEDKLNQKFLKEAGRFWPQDHLYQRYIRGLRQNVELFIHDNIPLQMQVELLSQRYQAICGAMSVEFQGKEYTLAQMNKFLYEPDRYLRESAWAASTKRRLKERQVLDRLFDEMFQLRCQIALNARCKDFCEYQFKALHRFDYTPEDCFNYHKVIEEVVLPLWQEMLTHRQEKLGVDSLRPWDLTVDPSFLPALKPFERIGDLLKGCVKVFEKIEPDFAKQFAKLMETGLLDLENRKGKAPGGYQTTLAEARQPFIFMNAIGSDDDLRTIFHEAGHAFHTLACANQPILDYRHGPMEFNEVASMGMELLAGEFLNEFYGADDTRRSQKRHWEDIVSTLVWVATIDCFQKWLYENPKHTLNERSQSWLAIRKRFGSDFVNWDGLEEEHSFLWHRQLHIFEAPFYYIEYGFAQLGALELWANVKKDWALALKNFREALSLGGSLSVPKLYQKAGLNFNFSKAVVEPLMEMVYKQWTRL